MPGKTKMISTEVWRRKGVENFIPRPAERSLIDSAQAVGRDERLTCESEEERHDQAELAVLLLPQ